AADGVLRVDRFGRLPRLAVERAGEPGREQIRLREIRAHAAIERGPLGFDARVPRAAEEVQVLPTNPRARLLLAAVADARGQPLVFALADGDMHRDIGRLRRLIPLRLDVHELEELHAVELLLAVANLVAAVELPRLERQLAPDDDLVDAVHAGHV